MENELLKLASSQGIWASLCVGLIFYILKAQEKRDINQENREKSYQYILKELTEKFNIIEGVKNDVKDIKEFISKNKFK